MYTEPDIIQDEHMFLKRVILYNAMLSYAIVWNGVYSYTMRIACYAMLWFML